MVFTLFPLFAFTNLFPSPLDLSVGRSGQLSIYITKFSISLFLLWISFEFVFFFFSLFLSNDNTGFRGEIKNHFVFECRRANKDALFLIKTKISLKLQFNVARYTIWSTFQFPFYYFLIAININFPIRFASILSVGVGSLTLQINCIHNHYFQFFFCYIKSNELHTFIYMYIPLILNWTKKSKIALIWLNPKCTEC